jgi:uncharacterized protein (TIGR02996 family)
MSDERKRFEDAIGADPYDLAVRKVFADWLEEHGDRPGDDDLAVLHRGWTVEKQQAKEWLEDFARDFDMSYDELMAAAFDALDRGRGVTLEFETPDRAFTDGRDFWRCFKLLTGRDEVDEDTGLFFRCAC